MKFLRLSVPCALLFALALLAPSPAAAEDALPPGVVARVYGREIRETEVFERLLKRWGSTERGKTILETLVDDVCVEAEAKKRGVTVSEDEVKAYVRHVDETIRKQTANMRTIEDVYKEQHSSAEEFARIAREYVKRQKMAAEDLGTKPGEEVSEARLKLWLASLRRRMNVRFADLPEGAVAVVGDAAIDRSRYAKALKETLPEESWLGALADLVLEAGAERALAAAGIVVTDADVDADIAEQRERFSKDPRVAGTGLTFDEFLKQTRGQSVADLHADHAYRTDLGLLRLLSRDISETAVKSHWSGNRDSYGERALVRQVFVGAQQSGATFHGRSFADAKELALRAKVAVLESSGAFAGVSPRERRSLADAVTAIAKQFEEDPDRKKTAGEPVAWTHVALLGQPALDKEVFGCELGTLRGPIECPDGYRLLLVEERRPAPGFDEVKPRVREDLLRVKLSEFRMKMRDDPNIVLPKK